MIINIRGTGGSGKSTVVRRIMELYPKKEPIFIQGRRQPLRYDLYPNAEEPLWSPTGPLPLVVPGHYETPTGGCDTLKSIEDVYQILYFTVQREMNAIFEGIISQDDVTRAVALSKRVGRENFLVITLTTPLAECLKGIQARRDARGDARPLSPTNTTNRAKRVKQIASRLKDAGVLVEALDREQAFLRARQALGWPSESQLAVPGPHLVSDSREGIS